MLVYKYRDGNINKFEDQEISNFERDIRSIEKNYFWGSNYNELNDPCEGLVLSDKFSKELNLLIKLLGKKKTEESKNLLLAFNNLLSQIEKIGIYSLSKTFKDALLWAHYGNSHKGFCIEYDLEELAKDNNNNFSVEYNENVPEIGLEDVSNEAKRKSITKKAFGYKHIDWKYESEYRIITNDFGINNYSYNAVKSIYFGLKMHPNQKNELMNRLKGRGIKYYQIKQLPKTYKFSAEPVEDINSSEITYLKRIKKSATTNEFINFKIIKQKYWAVGAKGDIEIELEKTITKQDLMLLADFIKTNLFSNAELVFMFYKINNQKDDYIAWATSHFRDKKTDIIINDFIEI